MNRVHPGLRRFLLNLLFFCGGVCFLALALFWSLLLPLSVVCFALAIAWGTDASGKYRLFSLPRTVFFGASCLILIVILFAATSLDAGFSGIGAVVSGAILLMITAAEAVFCLILRLIYRIALKQKFAPRAVSLRDWILLGIDAAAALTLAGIWISLV